MKLEQCYIGQTVGITVNGDKYIGGKHSAVFKNADGVNEVLISKLLGVLK